MFGDGLFDGINSRRFRVRWLKDRAEQYRQDGQDADANPLLEAAIQEVSAIMSESPQPNPEDLEMYGALNYGFGATAMSIGDSEGALLALERAESAYAALLDLGHSLMIQFIIDVKLRRVRTLRQTGQPTAALVELDSALSRTWSFDKATQRTAQFLIDFGRLLATTAETVADYGDVDIAVAAADAHIRMYIELGLQINTHEFREVYIDVLRDTASLAELLHAGQGSGEIAIAAGEIAVDTIVVIPRAEIPLTASDAVPMPDFRRSSYAWAQARHSFVLEEMGRRTEAESLWAAANETDTESANDARAGWPGLGAGRLTFANALVCAGQKPGLRSLVNEITQLLRPPDPDALTVSSRLRCESHNLSRLAESLAQLTVLLPAESEETLVIGFEAHLLFAMALNPVDDPSQRRQWLGRYAHMWRTVVVQLERVCQVHGCPELSADLSQYFTGALAR